MTRPSPRILQIGKHFHPDTGGIETVTKAISDLLDGQGIAADILVTGQSAAYPPLALPYRVHRFRSGLRRGNKGISLGYVHAVRRLQPDYDLAIVHLPNPVAVAAVAAFWRKPVILYWHAPIPYPAIRALTKPVDRWLARRAAAVVALTPVHLQESGDAVLLVPKGAVIGHAVDRTALAPPALATPAGQRARDFLAGRRLLLAVGRLVPYKGFELLIEAARGFPPGLAAIIVGDGPIRGDLRAAIDAAQVGDRVLLIGSIDDAARNELLAMAHIGCMPSITAQEMYGIAQVELMALGKPVIATRLPGSGVPWVNRDGETGLLVEPGSSEALAAAIGRLFGDAALYNRLSAGAAAAFVRNNDPATIAGDWADLVRAVAGGHPIPDRLKIA